jgi:hypothetical protein
LSLSRKNRKKACIMITLKKQVIALNESFVNFFNLGSSFGVGMNPHIIEGFTMC